MKNPLENLSPLHNLELFLKIEADKARLEHYKEYAKEKRDRSEKDEEETIKQYEIDKKKKKVPNKCFKDKSDELIEYLLEDYLTRKGISGGLTTLREKEENKIRKAIDTGIVPTQDNTDWLMKSRGLMVGLGDFLLKNHRKIYRAYDNSTFRLLEAKYGKDGGFGEIFEDGLDIFHSQDIPRAPKWRGREGRKEAIKFFKHLLEVHKKLALGALVNYHIEKIKDDSWKYDRNIMKMYMELGKKCGGAIWGYSKKKVVSKEFASLCHKEDELLEASYGRIFEDGLDILHRDWVRYWDRDRNGVGRKQLALEEILHTFENHVDPGIDTLMNIHKKEIKKYESELNKMGIRYKKDGLVPRISDLVAFHKILIENNEVAWREDVDIVLKYRDFIRKIDLDFFENNHIGKQIDILNNSPHTAIKGIYPELFSLDIIHPWDMTQRLNKKERKRIAFEAAKHLKEKHRIWKNKEEFIKTDHIFWGDWGLRPFIQGGFDDSVNQFKIEFAKWYGKELSGLTYLDIEYNELVKEEKETDKLISKARDKIDRLRHRKIGMKRALESVSLEANQKEWYLWNRVRRRMLKFKLGPDKYYKLMYDLFGNFLGRDFEKKKDVGSQSWRQAGLSKRHRLETITFIESHKNPKEGIEKILTTSNSPDRSDKTYYVSMNLPVKGVGRVRSNRLVTLIKFNGKKDREREAKILEYLADSGCDAPKSFFVDNKQGYLCMQSLDSVSQDQLLKEKSYDNKAGLRKAMKALRKLHDNGTRNLEHVEMYGLRLEERKRDSCEYDPNMGFYERSFKYDIGRIARLKGLKIDENEFNEIKKEYSRLIAEPLLKAKQYFSQADFYPAHVMEDGKIEIIDFGRAEIAPRILDFTNYVSYPGNFDIEQAIKDYSGKNNEIENELRESLVYGMVHMNLRLSGTTADWIYKNRGDRRFNEQCNKVYTKQLIDYLRKIEDPGSHKIIRFLKRYI